MWYYWSRDGWKSLDDETILLIQRFQSNHDNTNWCVYVGRKYKYDDNVTYKFSYPPKEMIKQYDLLPGDICSIMTFERDWFGKSGEGFTIIRDIQDESMKKEIKGGKKPKFFHV